MMLDVKELRRTYGGRGGVRQVTLSVPRASVYVLCGANGAGKTTTLSVISGLLFAESGTLTFTPRLGGAAPLALDRYQPRTGFGFAGDEPVLDPHLTPWQWLAFVAGLKQSPVDPDPALALAELLRISQDDMAAPIAALSFGNTRKVALWAEFLTTRDILILDEPLIGLDPVAIYGFRAAARQFTDSGRSILLSTHLLAEAEHIATHVGFLKEGRTTYDGPVDALEGSLLDAFLSAGT